jgi:hypothetical protein
MAILISFKNYIGSNHAVRFHMYTVMYGCKLALVPDEPAELTVSPVVLVVLNASKATFPPAIPNCATDTLLATSLIKPLADPEPERPIPDW